MFSDLVPDTRLSNFLGLGVCALDFTKFCNYVSIPTACSLTVGRLVRLPGLLGHPPPHWVEKFLRGVGVGMGLPLDVWVYLWIASLEFNGDCHGYMDRERWYMG